MGGGSSSSRSSVTQKYDTTIVKKEDINILSENVNSAISNTVIKQASICSASIAELQKVDFSNMAVGGDFNLTVNQEQQAALTFNCVQITDIKNVIANELFSQLMENVNTNFTSDIVDKLEANAKSNSASGAGSSLLSGPSSSNSNANVDYKYKDINDIHKNIQNIVKNSITNNLDIKSIQDCISKITQTQQVGVKNITIDGNVIAAIDQKQATSLLTSCMQKSSIGTNITGDIISKLGLTVEDSSTTKKSTTLSTGTSSTAESRGPMESIGSGVSTAAQGLGSGVGNAFGGVFGGFGNMFSNSDGSTNWGIIIFSVICCVMILIIGGAGLWWYTNKRI
jgi:hypothetical protein